MDKWEIYFYDCYSNEKEKSNMDLIYQAFSASLKSKKHCGSFLTDTKPVFKKSPGSTFSGNDESDCEEKNP